MSPALSTTLMRGPAFESLNDQGRGTKWSVGGGGGLVREGWRALTAQGLGDLGLPDPGKDRQRRVWADGLRRLGRDGPLCERSTGVDAGYQGEREQALTLESRYIPTPLMRA